MSAPGNPNPSPQNPAGKPELTVRIPSPPPSTVVPAVKPPPLPGPKTEPKLTAASDEPALVEEVGKPQLRAPEMKLSTPPPPPPKPPPLRAPRTAGSIWTVRIGLFAGVAVALALLYWSVFIRLLPVSAEHNARSREMTRVSDELESLRMRMTPDQIEAIKARYAQAQQALFDPAQELSAWQTQVSEQASAGTYEAKVNFGTPQPAGAIEGISAIPAEVTLQPTVIIGGTATPYARLLKFTESLATSPKRLDLLELSVTGNSNSVSQARAVVQLLAGEKKL